ncbi:hypothetical protein HanRHA438_Chr09g0412421 [Helianthus annuus]|nr:hypothetical protein HanIR_Chr09g0431551 [Helianthus annuus]KAJ0889397.1 hypothetical protein HanRHA438_Chr09g0412421 [Helianthus annuus]
MARLIGLDSGEGVGIFKFESSHIVFMLCMIVVSLSVLSMIIFACGDPNDQGSHKKHRHHGRSSGGFFSGGGGACGGGGGGGGAACGGGGGGC